MQIFEVFKIKLGMTAEVVKSIIYEFTNKLKFKIGNIHGFRRNIKTLFFI